MKIILFRSIAFIFYFSINYQLIGSNYNKLVNNHEMRTKVTKNEMLCEYVKFWGLIVFNTSKTKKQYLNFKSLAFKHLEQIKDGYSQEKYIQIIDELYNETKPEWFCKTVTLDTFLEDLRLYNLICKGNKDKSTIGKDIVIERLMPSKIFLKEADKDHYYWNDPEVSLLGNNNIEKNYSLQTSTLFAICKYWNAVNYFYPYKNEVNNWSEVLWKYIPKVDSVLSKKDYYMLIAQLTSEINDLHAFYAIHPIDSIFGQFQIGLNIDYINPDYIITAILDTNKFKLLPVKVGDKIMAINNIPVNQYVDSIIQYISGSRREVKYMEMERYLLFGKLRTPLLITTNRGKFSVTCTMKRFSKEYMNHSPNSPAFVNLNDSIVYINYGAVKSKRQLYKYFILASNSNKDILIDMTQIYHGNTHPVLSKFISDNSCTYARIKYPNEDRLGSLKLEDWKIIRKRKSLTYSHSQVFKQKIYVLINEKTRSHGEFVSQILIHCLGGIPIGRPTAGCDGDVRIIKLPLDFWTGISGIGIYGPEMQQYQINGIQPAKYIPARPEEFIGDYKFFLKNVVDNVIYKKQ